MTFNTIVSSNYFISCKTMLIKDDVRNSVIHLVVEWRRDGGNERRAFEEKIWATHL